MIDTVQQAKNVSMVDLASQFTTLTNQTHTGKHIGPCPICNDGTDRFVVFEGDNRWICRKCNKRPGGDQVDLVRAIYPALSFREAVAKVIGGVGSIGASTPIQPKPKVKKIVDMTAKYDSYRKMAEYAYNRLWSGHNASPVGHSYLKSRGFDLSVCKAWGLGLHWCKRSDDNGQWIDIGWGITLPWVDDQGNVTGINCRLTKPTKDGQRYQRYGYDRNGVFGVHRLSGNHKTLVIIEGELNAVALAHALPNTDIISVGSANHVPDQWIEKAAQWERVTVWMDDELDAQSVAERMPNAYWRSSTVDASDMLKRGDLSYWLKRGK